MSRIVGAGDVDEVALAAVDELDVGFLEHQRSSRLPTASRDTNHHQPRKADAHPDREPHQH